MSSATLKESLKTQKHCGYWSVIPCIQIHQILSNAGYSFGIIDLEHGTYSFQEALEASIAIKSAGMSCLIRPSSHCEKEILRCLEIGIDGICIPQVKNAEQAKKLVDACYYPPLGNRGASGFTKSSNYGNKDFKEHTQDENKKMFVSLLIEDSEGLRNIEEIGSVQGVDCIYFGTYDIASSCGIGDQDSVEVNKIISQAIEKLTNKELIFGQVSTNNYQYKSLDPRITLVAAGVDCGIIQEGSKKFLSSVKK